MDAINAQNVEIANQNVNIQREMIKLVKSRQKLPSTKALIMLEIFGNDLEDQNTYVGELGSKWTFCSDHLPVGAQVFTKDECFFSVVSWNVLNKAYISWVEKDTQGLKNSSIMDMHNTFSKRYKTLTLREEKVISQILSMIEDVEIPKDVICLQECGIDFVKVLKGELNENFPPITVLEHPTKGYETDQNITIYNSLIFDCESTKTTFNDFKLSNGGKSRPLFSALLKHKNTKEFYRFYNVHLPGDPTKDAPSELIDAVKRYDREDEAVFVLGDMNFPKKAFDKAFLNVYQNDHNFELVSSNYSTNISPKSFEDDQLKTKCIDLIYLKSLKNVSARPLEFYEVLQDESFFETLTALQPKI